MHMNEAGDLFFGAEFRDNVLDDAVSGVLNRLGKLRRRNRPEQPLRAYQEMIALLYRAGSDMHEFRRRLAAGIFRDLSRHPFADYITLGPPDMRHMQHAAAFEQSHYGMDFTDRRTQQETFEQAVQFFERALEPFVSLAFGFQHRMLQDTGAFVPQVVRAFAPAFGMDQHEDTVAFSLAQNYRHQESPCGCLRLPRRYLELHTV